VRQGSGPASLTKRAIHICARPAKQCEVTTPCVYEIKCRAIPSHELLLREGLAPRRGGCSKRARQLAFPFKEGCRRKRGKVLARLDRSNSSLSPFCWFYFPPFSFRGSTRFVVQPFFPSSRLQQCIAAHAVSSARLHTLNFLTRLPPARRTRQSPPTTPTHSSSLSTSSRYP